MTLNEIKASLEEIYKTGVSSREEYAALADIRMLAFKTLAYYPATLSALGTVDAEDCFKEDITRYNYKTRLEDEKTKFMKEFIEKQVDIGQIAKKLEIENAALRARLKAIRMVVNEDNDAKGEL